jgi:hypothetical protein
MKIKLIALVLVLLATPVHAMDAEEKQNNKQSTEQPSQAHQFAPQEVVIAIRRPDDHVMPASLSTGMGCTVGIFVLVLFWMAINRCNGHC